MKRLNLRGVEKDTNEKSIEDILADAGCDIAPSGCGACLGGPPDTLGRLNSPLTCISSTNRNFPGRMGDKRAGVYLASPLTVAASALTGYVTDPREFVSEQDRHGPGGRGVMSKLDEKLIAEIQKLTTRAQLLTLLIDPVAQAAFGPPGKAFEYLIIRAFELDGLLVQYPYEVRSGDLLSDGSKRMYEQVDGVVYGSVPFLIESKDYAAGVSIEPIAKLRFRLESRPSHAMSIVFARSSLTGAAEFFLRSARPRNVLTWYGSELEYALASTSPKPFATSLDRKFRRCVENGVPDYNIT